MEQQDPNDLYVLDEELYQEWMLPMCEAQGLTPWFLVQFIIDLPFHFPRRADDTFAIMTKDDALCSYKFFDFYEEDKTLSASDKPAIQVLRSSVEMTYITTQEINLEENVQPDNTDLTNCFDTLIDHLNVLLLAYLIKTKDERVYRISKEMVNYLTMARVIDVNNWDKIKNLIFILHLDVPVNREPMTEENTEKVVSYVPVIRDILNPFVLHEELFLTAKRYLREGYYREACIFVQMMIENMLDNLFTQLLLLEGKNNTEANEIREGIPFLSLVKKEFHVRVGGQWDVNNPKSECGTWYNKTYITRNRVSHGGYFPTLKEASEAVDAAQNLRVYILSLLKKKKQFIDIVNYLT